MSSKHKGQKEGDFMPHFGYEGFHEVVMISEDAPLKGEKHRSSKNYTFVTEAFHNCKKVHISVEGTGKDIITFDIKKDHTAANDETLHKDVHDGSIITNPKGKGIYIANPKHASGQFRIRVTVADDQDMDVDNDA